MRRGNGVKRIAFGLTFGLMAWFPTAVSACPTCKEGLESNGTSIGFALSILLMLLMPMLLFACWAVALMRWSRYTNQTVGLAEGLDTLPDPQIHAN